MLLAAATTTAQVMNNVSFCADTANIWQLVGYVIFVFKILIPVLLIIFGMIDLGTAVVSSDDKAIKTATSSLVKRLVIAIVIFFIPTLVGFVFDIIGGFTADMKKEYNVCKKCLVSPFDSACKKNADSAWS